VFEKMDFVIKRKVLISMLFLGLTLMGVVSYKNLSLELYPSAELPYLFVQVNSSTEVDPGYMENQAVIPLEGAIGTLGGIESIESYINSRNAQILVSYKKNVNFKFAYLKLQERINQIKTSLPENFMVDVSKVDVQSLNNQFMELQVRGGGSIDRVRTMVDQDIVPQLENVDGIASSRVFGGRQKSIEIQLNTQACEAFNITPASVNAALRKNAADKTFVGYVFESGKRYFVNITAEYTDIRDIENIIVAQGPILLKDVADIFFGEKEETSYSRVNGKNAVTLLLMNDASTNLIELSHKAKDEINLLNRQYKSQDLEIIIQSNVAETMETNINQIIRLALIGGILAIFVLWIFLKNLRIVSIVAIAIPVSVFTAFNFFYAFDITLNSLTLVGIALAVGMLLDNSVVVLENIYRLSAGNLGPDRAVTQGTREVWRAIFAATLTTVMVFVPFLFSVNYMIKLIGQNIGVSIVSTLIISFLVALLFIPMAAHFLLKKGKNNNLFFEKVSTNNRIIQIYILILKASLRSPARTVIGAITLFFLTIFISLAISVNTLKEAENDQFKIFVTMPSGSDLETTDKVVQQVEDKLSKIEEKKDIISQIEEEEAIITVKLKKNFEKIADHTLSDIKSSAEDDLKNISAADISLSQPTTGSSYQGSSRNPATSFERLLGMGSNSERIVIKGSDFEVMEGVSEDLQYFIDDLESISRVSANTSSNRPEVHMYLNPLLMTEYDITLNEISTELGAFSSQFSSGMKFKQGTDEYDILVTDGKETEKTRNKNMEDLKNLQIISQNGGIHPLGSFSELVYANGKRRINRVDQEKQIEINYSFVSEAQDSKELLESYRMEVDDIIAGYKLPPGVAVQVIHEENELKDFYFLIGAAFVLIFMILASVFESLVLPFVLMFSIPLAAIGSFIALIITGNSLFNANTLTGFLILVGVVVNNSIILIDYTNILRKRGFRKTRALMVAGLSRVRPILITAITTIVAMIPLAMGKAEYVSIIGAPFAITVIGGLSFSTLFTLIFVPTLYYGLENALTWFHDLPLKTKLIQFLVLILGAYLIYTRVDSFLWKMLLFVLIILLVPGTTWFIRAALRRAGSLVTNSELTLQIKIQNLVKIYERDPRFTREWKGGKRIRARAGLENNYESIHDFYDLVWQLPLVGFLVYFTYFYLTANFWAFLFAVTNYLLLLYLYRPVRKVLSRLNRQTGKTGYMKIDKVLYQLLFWGIPMLNLFLFFMKWNNKGLLISAGVLWYLGLIVSYISVKLYREKINVDRITGKFGTLRRNLLRLIKQIPLIGKQRQPFKALDGVSFNIGTGMFGLLGPNGAGKSTMMRIICGILDQSYGKIWINGIDTLEKREELQSLIGYLPQEFGMYENLTAREYLDYQAILKGIVSHVDRSERISYVLNSVHMIDHENEKIGSFSGGMKQRIGIAQILLHLPKILVVDEPTAGLDPRERIRFRNMLVELSRERIVIFSTHIIEDISSSCNTAAVLDHGRVKFSGEPENMAKLAEKFVWQFVLPAREFNNIKKKDQVVRHMRDGENIKVRMISKEKPRENAVNVKPLLEDAYLCLLKDINKG